CAGARSSPIQGTCDRCGQLRGSLLRTVGVGVGPTGPELAKTCTVRCGDQGAGRGAAGIDTHQEGAAFGVFGTRGEYRGHVRSLPRRRRTIPRSPVGPRSAPRARKTDGRALSFPDRNTTHGDCSRLFSRHLRRTSGDRRCSGLLLRLRAAATSAPGGRSHRARRPIPPVLSPNELVGISTGRAKPDHGSVHGPYAVPTVTSIPASCPWSWRRSWPRRRPSKHSRRGAPSPTHKATTESLSPPTTPTRSSARPDPCPWT